MTISLTGPVSIKLQSSAGANNIIALVANTPAPIGMLPSDVQVIYSPGIPTSNPPYNIINLWAYGGTEFRNLATHNGNLYGGLGYWQDAPIPGQNVPSGGSIISMSGANSLFQIEQQFSTKFFAICALYDCQWPTGNTMYCSTWTKIGYNILYYRDDTTNSWNYAKTLSANPRGSGNGSGQQAQIRSMALYTDTITSQPLLFVGDTPNGIWSIPHDATQLGGLGNPTLELNTTGFIPPNGGSDVRIMSFTTWNGLLYATVTNNLYVRNNGASPSWTLLYTDNQYVSTKTGFRGLTKLPNNHGFIVGREGSNAGVMQLTNASGSWVMSNAYMWETDLANAWGNTYGGAVNPGYGIIAYNGMTSFTSPNGNTALFIGFESYVQSGPPNMPLMYNPSDNGNLYSLAPFLIYNWDGTGEFHLNHFPAVTYQSMESTRVSILSPFNSNYMYIGGFDCNGNVNHNAAWLVSCSISSLLNNKLS